MQTFINPARDKWNELIRRTRMDDDVLKKNVSDILVDIKQNGDAAIKKYSLQFGKVHLNDLRVSEQEIEDAITLVNDDLKNAIQIAKANIEKFHRSQKEDVIKVETTSGVWCWRKSVAIDKVGLYIPGGTAPLFSTLLMLGIPATIAGCREIIVCTPSDTNGKVNDVVLYVSWLLGLKNIYRIGGAQAIAAMAYGSATVPAVYKIFGPGNQYVTCAKQLVNSEGIAIDMLAGPSEVAVYADENCNPSYVAADLLSQAEHGVDSQMLLIATSEAILTSIQNQVNLQIESLERKKIAEKALSNSCFTVMKNVNDAVDLLNEYAPEHLIIASDNAEELSAKVRNAGSVFLGHYSAESAGDYASGTNHTLPTNGYAKVYSGVSLDSFVKKITFQQVNQEGLKNIGKTVQSMAEAEGLHAHSYAIKIRNP